MYYTYNITTCTNYLTDIFMHTGKTINFCSKIISVSKSMYTNIENTVSSNTKLFNFYFLIFGNLTNDLKVF